MGADDRAQRGHVAMTWTQAVSRLDRLSGRAKTAIVAGGYIGALLAACSVLAVYIAQTSGSDRDHAGGMYAFGDALLFLVAWGAASTPPTLLALYFVRRVHVLWSILSMSALAVSLTGLAAAVTVSDPHLSASGVWSALAVPRIFFAPVLAAIFALTAMLSYQARHRWWLMAAAGLECVTSAYGFVHWFVPLLLVRAT